MEPISLAIGVVPLITNIISTTSRIRDKVALYHAATSDIQGIFDKTTLVGQICAQIETDMRASDGSGDTAILRQALKMCHSSVSAVDKDLDKIQGSGPGRKRAVRYLWSKKDVDKSSQDLTEALQLLNTCIGLRVLALASLPQLPVLSHHIPSWHAPSRKQASRAWKKYNHAAIHHNVLYSYRANYSSSKQQETSGEVSFRSYLVGIPFFGTYVSLAIRCGPLNPLRVDIDLPSIIHEVDNKVLYDMLLLRQHEFTAEAPDIGNLTAWCRKWKVKGNTQLVSGSGIRETVLSRFISTNISGVKEFLTAHGTEGLEDSIHLPWGCKPRGDTDDYLEDPVRFYVESRGPFLTIGEYLTFADWSSHSKFHTSLYEACQNAFLDDWDNFVTQTFSSITFSSIVGNIMTSPEQKNLKAQGQLIARLVSDGLDPHRYYHVPGQGHVTALGEAIEYMLHMPDNDLDSASQWLETLRYANMDVDEYLRVELEMELKKQNRDYESLTTSQLISGPARAKLETFCNLINPGMVYVQRRAVPEDGTTDDLLEVQPGLRLAWQMCLHIADCGRNPKSAHRRLKAARVRDPAWPFLVDTRASFELQRGMRNISQDVQDALDSHAYLLKLMESRFERNQQRKWRKWEKRERAKMVTFSMPGSWETEWWEHKGAW